MTIVTRLDGTTELFDPEFWDEYDISDFMSGREEYPELPYGWEWKACSRCGYTEPILSSQVDSDSALCEVCYGEVFWSSK